MPLGRLTPSAARAADLSARRRSPTGRVGAAAVCRLARTGHRPHPSITRIPSRWAVIAGDNIYGIGPAGELICICIPARSWFRLENKDPGKVVPGNAHLHGGCARAGGE
jgi:hypothetical protein